MNDLATQMVTAAYQKGSTSLPQLLVELHRGREPVGMGALRHQEMTWPKAVQYLLCAQKSVRLMSSGGLQIHFDYVLGVPFKISIYEGYIDAGSQRLYDRDGGHKAFANRFARAVEATETEMP